MTLPIARTENLVVQEAGDELLIYDLIKHKAFCLNETSAIVYRACDEKKRLDELISQSGFTDELIFLALDELKRVSLLPSEYQSPLAGMNRREAIGKVGLATMTALPVITALTAPKAAHAQSPTVCELNSCADNNASCNGGGGGCATTFLAQGGGECCTAFGACFCTPVGTCVPNQGGEVCL